MMTPGEFGAALNWGGRVVRVGKLCWVSDSGTTVSIGTHGTKVRVTHRLTAEEWWVPCDAVGLGFVWAFDADRPSA